MNNLLWKQWRENRGYLLFFSLWMVLAAGYCLSYEIAYRFRAIVGQFSGWTLMYSIVAAIFLAMYVALGERTTRTIGFSRALPVSTRKLAAYRISGAACTLALPIVLAAIVISIALMGGLVEQVAPRTEGHASLLERETGSLLTSLEQLWSVTAISICGGIELLLVLSLIGTRLRTQSQVGFLGAVLGLGSIVASGLLWFGRPNHYAQFVYGAILPQSLVIQWGYGVESGSFTDHEFAQYRWYSLALAIPILWLIGRRFVLRYGRFPKPSKRQRTKRFRYLTPAILSHLKLRFRSRWRALLWLELRQSVPLVFYGFLFALLISMFTALTESHHSSSFGAKIQADLPHNIRVVGMLWATVVGAGIFAAELEPRLGAFWRSRPISSAMWFWSKYVVGWLAVILILDGVTILVSWTADRGSMTAGMSWAYVLCIPILHMLLYSLAVFGTCWLRKPVLGGFAALLSLTLVIIAIDAFPFTSHFDPINVHNELLSAERDGVIDFTQHGYPLVYGSMLVASLALAWFSARLVRPLEPQATRWSSLMASS